MTQPPPKKDLQPENGDEHLLEQLRVLAGQFDPVPENLLAAARGSYTWRTIDAELAALAYDSVLDEDRAALVRSDGEARLLTFEALGLTIEIEVTDDDGERRLLGQLVPAYPAIIEISHAGGELTVLADQLGRFSAGPLEAGAASLRCRRTGPKPGATIKTEWVTI